MARTEMGQPDAKGRRRAEIVPGSEHVVPADAVVMAFGFRPHSMEWLAKHSVELDSQGRIIAPEGSENAFQTSNENLRRWRYRSRFRSGGHRDCRRP